MNKKYELSDEAKERKANYIKGYEKEHYRYFSYKCRIGADDDLLNFLAKTHNKSEIVKEALREYIRNHK